MTNSPPKKRLCINGKNAGKIPKAEKIKILKFGNGLERAKKPAIKSKLAGSKLGLTKIDKPKKKEHKNIFLNISSLLSELVIPKIIPNSARKYPILPGNVRQIQHMRVQ